MKLFMLVIIMQLSLTGCLSVGMPFTAEQEADMTKNFAHRGYKAQFPENTLLAFSEALKAGCDGIELDVQLSKDGEIVIKHDVDLERTTSGTGLIKDRTLAELKALDAGGGEQIPTLAEYFDLIAGSDIITNIEFKNNNIPYEGLEEKVLELVRERGMSERVIFSSFNHASVDKLKRLAPDIQCGYLVYQKLDLEAVIAAMRESGIEFIHPNVNIVDEDFLEVVERYSIPFSVYTVNDAETMRRMIELGAYAVFTDDPTLFNETKEKINFHSN